MPAVLMDLMDAQARARGLPLAPVLDCWMQYSVRNASQCPQHSYLRRARLRAAHHTPGKGTLTHRFFVFHLLKFVLLLTPSAPEL